jgi:hypothetical protein
MRLTHSPDPVSVETANQKSMKTRIKCQLLTLALVSTLNPQLSTLLAQGTAFTYQGRLDNNGSPANGSYDLTFGLFSVSNGPGQVGITLTNLSTGVNGGLFMTTLDFGPGIFTGTNLWLEIAVRTNGAAGFSTLSPRRQLTPTPYAIFANSANNLVGPLGSAQLTGTYSSPVNFNNGADTFDGTFFGQFYGSTFTGGTFTGAFLGNGSGLAGVNAATLGGLGATNFWKTTGNAGAIPGPNFLGTTDNQAMELKVNGTRALRLEPNTNGAPNVIGGSPNNFVSPGVGGATISGGGAVNSFGSSYTNSVMGDFGTVGGGLQNTSSGGEATVGGGYGNTSSGGFAIVGGGYGNTNSGTVATVGGGYVNINNGYAATIGGGEGNVIQPGVTWWSTIGGGRLNSVQSNNYSAVIAGGEKNSILPNASYSFIGGGLVNAAAGAYATVGGGSANLNGSDYSTIAGGANNTNQANTSFSAIGGGWLNLIQDGADQSVIAGGNAGQIQSGARESFIGGGYANTIQTNAGGSVIGGGVLNVISNGAGYATIGGGVGNLNNGQTATIGGGNANTSSGSGATVAGGAYNLSSGTSATVGGGLNNLSSGSGATVGGGLDNIGSGLNATIGGGQGNTNSGNSAVIGGGYRNTSRNYGGTVSGGYLNTASSAYDTVGGGAGNVASNGYATVPGGANNFAGGQLSFAAGYNAKALHYGAFVWADTSGLDFASTTNDQFLIRATNGVGINKNNPATALDVNGIVTATGFNGAGAGLTSLNAANLSGSVPSAALTSVPAGSLTGAIADARLSANVTLLNANQTFAGVNAMTNPANSFTGNGAGLTSLNAANLSGSVPSAALTSVPASSLTGTIADARLSTNVALLSANQVFTGSNTFGTTLTSASLTVNNTARIQGGNNWNVTGGEGDFRVGNDSFRFKIGVANGGSGSGDIWMRAHGGTQRIFIKTPGGTSIYSNEGETAGVSLAANGTAWAVISDRNVKKDIAPVDERVILEKLADLSITQWHYQWESADVTPHIGPMAQDFKAAFYPGTDDKSITTQEADGVALAAIQGLNRKLEERLKAKDAQLEALERRLERLERAGR